MIVADTMMMQNQMVMNEERMLMRDQQVMREQQMMIDREIATNMQMQAENRALRAELQMEKSGNPATANADNGVAVDSGAVVGNGINQPLNPSANLNARTLMVSRCSPFTDNRSILEPPTTMRECRWIHFTPTTLRT